ncbi:hypothetical protein I7I50_04662 [Histoplasma capsulatum G186AR]|uniref:Uncharacterized protein n=1 Tax=Ajellomyces capsulatus TaxID=5037 RepID=A0A8H7YMZ6_AJECA|nr:hypothetical protein I7I52_05571 [Histoplasma capsulatum]QSS75508.1 hypothetical protein I7I50_04662 [Histoplasma capsulatum G186AR]
MFIFPQDSMVCRTRRSIAMRGTGFSSGGYFVYATLSTWTSRDGAGLSHCDGSDSRYLSPGCTACDNKPEYIGTSQMPSPVHTNNQPQTILDMRGENIF